MFRTPLLPLLGSLTALVMGLGQAAAVEVAPSEQNTAIFDLAWSKIEQQYWDPNFGGVDWEAVRDELRPRAEAAESQMVLRQVLNEMLGRLGQSHFGVIAGGAPETDLPGHPECAAGLGDRLVAVLAAGGQLAGDAGAGLELRPVGTELVVFRVAEESSARAAGIRPGYLVHAIDGQVLAPIGECLGAELDETERQDLVWRLAESLLEGWAGDELELEVVDENGEVLRKQIERGNDPREEVVQFGNLPSMRVLFEAGAVERPTGARIGVIRFSTWMMPVAAAFEKALLDFQELDGIVLDLRGNPGGIAGLASGIGGYFVAEPKSLGTLKRRREELELRINPRRTTRSGERIETYEGPLVLLVDRFSASTSEIFAAGLKEHGRAHIVGERTAGAALPALAEELPNGDIMMYAIADFLAPSGTRIEGQGVVPDEVVVLTREDLLAGRDAALESALSWVEGQTSGGSLAQAAP